MKNLKILKKNFDNDGFIVIKKFLSIAEIKQFEKSLLKIYSNITKKKLTHIHVHKAVIDAEKNKDFDLLYSCLKKFIVSSPYKKLKKKFSNLSQQIFKKKYKYLNSGMAIGIKGSKRTAYDWHQEQSYYSVKNTIHFQFPIITKARKTNGTMSVLKGSQKAGPINKVKNIKLSKKSINTLLPKNINNLKKIFKEVYINMDLGDVCMFSENIVHKTNKSYSNKVRFVPIIRLQSTALKK
jgi:ectoine hydroxylase-related dioxygenase (phytanoyl-CoA dioxygenase family)